MNSLEFMRELSRRLVRGSADKTRNGKLIFTPDGVKSYDALWLRDFSYMAEYAPDSVTDSELKDCIDFAVGGARRDGWLPDRRYADGLTVYAAGGLLSPVGRANLDNTPFGVFMAYEYVRRTGDMASFENWYPVLEKGMLSVPLSQNGLVYCDPAAPHSPYGFTDTVCKTGELFTESILFHRACRFLQNMHPGVWEYLADRIEQNIGILYDENSGVFLAATGDCRQPDVWGNALMLYYGFPAGEKETRVLAWLYKNRADYLYKGQVRHLLKGEYWQKLLIDVPKETYQNGAYWATASGWLAWCLFRADRAVGKQTIAEAVRFLKSDGSYECVNADYRKLASFVVSATNVLGGLERIIAEDPSALCEIDRLA